MCVCVRCYIHCTKSELSFKGARTLQTVAFHPARTLQDYFPHPSHCHLLPSTLNLPSHMHSETRPSQVGQYLVNIWSISPKLGQIGHIDKLTTAHVGVGTRPKYDASAWVVSPAPKNGQLGSTKTVGARGNHALAILTTYWPVPSSRRYLWSWIVFHVGVGDVACVDY